MSSPALFEDDQPDFRTYKELTDTLQIHHSTARRLVLRLGIPTHRRGSRRYMTQADFDLAVEAYRHPERPFAFGQ